MKTMLITGGSSGIGKATVQYFLQKGYRVFELSRHGESYDGVTHLYCDVTKPEDCRNAVTEVIAQCDKIDVLISNAGMGISGAIEFTGMEEARKQLDVNFYGAVNITQAVLPYMREAGGGSIIFVSSLAGVFAIPFQAFYSASKAATISFAMALKNEVRQFGISVSCMLPGDVKTGFTSAREKSAAGSDVYTNLNRSVNSMEKDEQNGLDPMCIAKKLYQMAESSSPRAINTVGLMYKAFLLLNKLLPTTLAYRIVGMMYASK